MASLLYLSSVLLMQAILSRVLLISEKSNFFFCFASLFTTIDEERILNSSIIFVRRTYLPHTAGDNHD